MAQIEIEFISDGFAEILRSDGVKKVIESKAQEIQQRANSNVAGEHTDGYKVTTMHSNGKDNRWVSFVQAADYVAAEKEAEYKALTKAVK